MRVAVIGGGIAGMACAWLLRERHDVVLFEKEPQLGGHAHTTDVECEGTNYAVDTGFIVYNDRTYPNFIRLLDQLGVTGRPTQMSFSVSCDESGVEYGSHSLSGLFAQRRNLVRRDHYRMLLDILRFNRESRALIEAPCGLSLGEYLARGKYSPGFVQRYLLPMCGAIWSGSLESAADFPADHFVEFFENHGLLTVADQPQWHVVRGGSRAYVRALAAGLDSRVRAGTPVRAVRRAPGGVELEAAGVRETFDRVVFACHSDQALALLADPSEREREILGGLPFQANEVVLHHDESLMPRNRRAWAAWNYRVTGDERRPATVTYDMNRLQHLAGPAQLCLSLNLSERIDPHRVLRRYRYDHPVYTRRSGEMRRRRAEISGGQTYYCGAYWENGFHEDGVRSALDVARPLGGVL